MRRRPGRVVRRQRSSTSTRRFGLAAEDLERLGVERGATTISRKIEVSASATARSTSRVSATTPPKALTGSPSSAASQASSRVARSAAPHGLVCLTMTHAGAPQARPSAAAAAASSTLLYESALPWSGARSTPNGPSSERRARSPVAGGRLVRVLAVAQRLDLLERDGQVAGYGSSGASSRPASTRRRPAGAPPRCARRRRPCGRTPRARARAGAVVEPVRRVQRREDGVVARRRRHDRHVGVVLRRRPDHRRPADVDLLDELVDRDAGSLEGRRERVEVDDDELERRDPGAEQLAPVVGEPPIGEQAGVDRGWSVLTRPSSISGEPVTAATSVTGRPASRSAAPSRRSRRARTRGRRGRGPGRRGPVLSETDSSARRGDGTRASARSRSIVTWRPSVGHGDRAGQQQRHRPGQQPVLDRLDPLVQGRLVVVREDRDRLLGHDRAAVERRVDEVDRHAGHRPAVRQRVADGMAPGNAGSSDGWVLRIRPRNAASTDGPTSRM